MLKNVTTLPSRCHAMRERLAVAFPLKRSGSIPASQSEVRSLLQVGERFILSLALARDGQFEALGDVTIFLPNGRGEGYFMATFLSYNLKHSGQ
jgi:hypothetical protein